MAVAYLAAERAKVLGVLADFCLLDLLTKTGTVPGTILTNNPDLFRALRLQQVTKCLHCTVSLSSAEVRAKTCNETSAKPNVTSRKTLA